MQKMSSRDGWRIYKIKKFPKPGTKEFMRLENLYGIEIVLMGDYICIRDIIKLRENG